MLPRRREREDDDFNNIGETTKAALEAEKQKQERLEKRHQAALAVASPGTARSAPAPTCRRVPLLPPFSTSFAPPR